MFRLVAIIALWLTYGCGSKPDITGYMRQYIPNGAIYAIGTATATNESIAEAKATLLARADLAKRLNTSVIVGSRRVKTLIKHDQGKYTAIVLVIINKD